MKGTERFLLIRNKSKPLPFICKNLPLLPAGLRTGDRAYGTTGDRQQETTGGFHRRRMTVSGTTGLVISLSVSHTVSCTEGPTAQWPKLGGGGDINSESRVS